MNFLFLSKNFNQIDQVFMPKLLLTKETEFKTKLFQAVIHSNTYIILKKKRGTVSTSFNRNVSSDLAHS